MDVGMKIRQL